jgi:glycosyltransferase involved in cell wall biosynthesis
MEVVVSEASVLGDKVAEVNYLSYRISNILKMIMTKIRFKQQKVEKIPTVLQSNIKKMTMEEALLELQQLDQNNAIQGIIFIDAAFDFDEHRNQRTIAFAKAFVSLGYFVFFIRNQWSTKDCSAYDFNLFHNRVFQIPRFIMSTVLTQEWIAQSSIAKYFIATIPDNYLLEQYLEVRQSGCQLIYDILDNWEELAECGSAPWYEPSIEQFFVNNADAVFAVSQPLVDKFKLTRLVQLLSNGIFGEPCFLPRLKEEGQFHAGYLGHLTDKWFDWDLVFELAEDKRFIIHLIGEGAPQNMLERANLFSNIIYYGYIPQPQLVKYVASFDVGLIPFKTNKLSESVDPLKVYEYLQFGRPVVSTGIPHLSNYPYCRNVKNSEEFKETIIYAIEEMSLDVNEINQFLMDNSWFEKCRRLLQLN